MRQGTVLLSSCRINSHQQTQPSQKPTSVSNTEMGFCFMRGYQMLEIFLALMMLLFCYRIRYLVNLFFPAKDHISAGSL